MNWTDGWEYFQYQRSGLKLIIVCFSILIHHEQFSTSGLNTFFIQFPFTDSLRPLKNFLYMQHWMKGKNKTLLKHPQVCFFDLFCFLFDIEQFLGKQTIDNRLQKFIKEKFTTCGKISLWEDDTNDTRCGCLFNNKK